MAQHIDRWIAEHRNFERLLEAMDRQIELFHRGERPDYGLMFDIVHYMRNYPDEFHHPQEDVAFARVAEREAAARHLIEDLHGQHRLIARSGKVLQEELDAVVAGAMMPRSHVEQPARQYVDFFRRHMREEETALFPLARQVLRDKDWKEIDAQVPKGIDPLFGCTVQERYRMLQQRIAQAVGCDCNVV